MRTVETKPDDALADDAVVIRRVTPGAPRPDGKREISKSAFSPSSAKHDPEEGMSVDLMSSLEAQGIDPADREQFAPNIEVLMTIRVRDLHEEGIWVVPRPLTANPAHCNVLNVTKSKRKAILVMADFFAPPGGCSKIN